MVIKKLSAGTRIYLKKKIPHALYIQPDQVLKNDNLYVAYDVRSNGTTIIPKGTRVIGNWITESKPTIAAQLQITRIYLCGSGQQISADSDVIEATSDYNKKEVNNACHLYKQNQYLATSNITRRIVNSQCKISTLLDNDLDTLYLEISTNEIPVTLTSDFIAFPCLS